MSLTEDNLDRVIESRLSTMGIKAEFGTNGRLIVPEGVAATVDNETGHVDVHYLPVQPQVRTWGRD